MDKSILNQDDAVPFEQVTIIRTSGDAQLISVFPRVGKATYTRVIKPPVQVPFQGRYINQEPEGTAKMTLDLEKLERTSPLEAEFFEIVRETSTMMDFDQQEQNVLLMTLLDTSCKDVEIAKQQAQEIWHGLKRLGFTITKEDHVDPNAG